jgi:hypothetical protein
MFNLSCPLRRKESKERGWKEGEERKGELRFYPVGLLREDILKAFFLLNAASCR